MHISYTKQAANAVRYAAKKAKEMKHPYIGTEHLLLGLREEFSGVAGQVLAQNGVETEKIMQLMDELIAPREEMPASQKPKESPRLRYILANSEKEAHRLRTAEVGTEHLLLSMIRDVDCVAARILITLNISLQKLLKDILNASGVDPKDYQDELQDESRGSGSVIEQYCTDMTARAEEGKQDPVVGREEEMYRLMQVLSRRTKNNPCLIGEPGVGKTAVVEGLAQRITQGLVPEKMKNRRLVVLDLSGMVAGSKYRGEFEERIKKVIAEVMEHPGILLFIDELHTIIGAGGAEGALDASNILKPSLSRGEIQIIGATTIEEYRKHIEKDAALERRFQPVTVEEPTQEQAVEILKGLRPYYEKHHGVTITDEALEAAVKMSIRYIADRHLPDKAIDLMDEASSRVQLTGITVPPQLKEVEQNLHALTEKKEEAIREGDFSRARELQEGQKELEESYEKLKKRQEQRYKNKKMQVTEENIAQIVSSWTKIPVQKLAQKESKRLASLEKELHKRVIGQEEAVEAVAKAIKRGRVGLKDPSRPIGSFLFLGPTGVGKTELSKALAETVFGSEQAMIRVDMSEYMEKHSVSKLIGSPPGYVGYEEGGQLSEKIRRNPYSVILFDEIEKAHPDVFNILLQVLDDGHITDAQGRKVDFKQTCIIMTSNAGAQSIVEPKRLGFSQGEDKKKDYEDMKRGVMEEVRRIFKPEFLNRVDEILVFHMLDKQEIRQIVNILVKKLEKRCKEQLDIELVVRNSVKDYLAENGFDSKYGARPLKRAIQNKLEDRMAEEILDGKIHRGDRVIVSVSKKVIKFSVND